MSSRGMDTSTPRGYADASAKRTLSLANNMIALFGFSKTGEKQEKGKMKRNNDSGIFPTYTYIHLFLLFSNLTTIGLMCHIGRAKTGLKRPIIKPAIKAVWSNSPKRLERPLRAA